MFMGARMVLAVIRAPTHEWVGHRNASVAGGVGGAGEGLGKPRQVVLGVEDLQMGHQGAALANEVVASAEQVVRPSAATLRQGYHLDLVTNWDGLPPIPARP